MFFPPPLEVLRYMVEKIGKNQTRHFSSRNLGIEISEYLGIRRFKLEVYRVEFFCNSFFY